MSSRRLDLIVLILCTLLAVLATWAAVTGLRMTGDLGHMLQGKSPAYTTFADFERRFGSGSEDMVLSVEAPDLGAELAALEDLVIELQLTDGVAAVVSLFSLPDPEAPGRSYLARPGAAALDGAARLDGLWAELPLARDLLARDRSLTALTVLPDPAVDAATRNAALAATLAAADPALHVARVGVAALHSDVVRAMSRDQLMLTSAAIVLCLGLSMAMFRSFSAMLICGLPPIFGLAWSLGALAVSGAAMDPLLAMVPTVLIVLGFSDSVHLYHAIHRASGNAAQATRQGLAETWPALVLTSATTALAFLSLITVPSPAMQRLAVAGALGLTIMLGAVVLVLPALARLAFHRGAAGQPVAFAPLARLATALLPRWRITAALGIVALVLLYALQTQTRTGFDMTDHVPVNSPFRSDLGRLEAALPGSDRIQVEVVAADPAPGIQPSDTARLKLVAAAIWGGAMALPADATLHGPLADRMVAADGSGFALPVAAPLGADGWATVARADELRDQLAAAGLAGVTRLTGYSLMAATEIPSLINDLRRSFYVAVGLVTLLALVLTRSLRLAAVSLVPNLIPILGVEGWLVLADKPLTMTGVIALTIAFGIAVDATIHLLNRLRLAQRAHHGQPAVAEALHACLPPVMTTSLILLAGFSTTVFSLLPSISLFGLLIATTLGLAALADLLLFPGLLIWAIGKRGRA